MMKTVIFINEPNFDFLSEHGFYFICNEDMNYMISSKKFSELINKFPWIQNDMYEL